MVNTNRKTTFFKQQNAAENRFFKVICQPSTAEICGGLKIKSFPLTFFRQIKTAFSWINFLIRMGKRKYLFLIFIYCGTKV